MRKLMILMLVFLLIGCREEAKAPTYELENLKAQPVVLTEKSTYYIHNNLMPTYADLLKYPDEHLIDWDESTYTSYEAGNQLTFVFDQKERVYAVDLMGCDLKRVRLGFGSQGIQEYVVMQNQVILDQGITSDTLTVTLLDDCNLSEVHIRVESEVSQETYEAFMASEGFLKKLHLQQNWSEDIEANIDVATFMMEDMGLEALKMHAQWVDLSVLKDDLVGYPIILRGQVVAVEAKINYYEVIVDPIVLKQNLKIIMREPVELDKIIDMSGIYIGYDDQHVFYGLK